MVYFFDFHPLGRTKKRLNQSSVDLNGVVHRKNVFSKLKRRFSQSERDISSLDLQDGVQRPDVSFDDSLIAYTITRLAEKPLLLGVQDAQEQATLDQQGLQISHQSTQKQKAQEGDPPRRNFVDNNRDFEQQSGDLTCVHVKSPGVQAPSTHCFYSMHRGTEGGSPSIYSKLEDDFVCIDLNANSLSSETMFAELTSPVRASSVTADGLDSLRFEGSEKPDLETQGICGTLETANVEVQDNGEKDGFQTIVNRLKSAGDEHLLEGLKVCASSPRTGQLLGKFEIGLDGTGTELNGAWCQTEPSVTGESSNLSIKDSKEDSDSTDCCDESNEVCRRLENKAQLVTESVVTRAKIQRKNGTTQSPPMGTKSQVGTKSQIGTREWPSFDDEYRPPRQQHERAPQRMLSAPSLLQLKPEEHTRLQKIYRSSSSRERCNSLKSALKRRSLSVSSASCLKVRFNLEEETGEASPAVMIRPRDEVNKTAKSKQESPRSYPGVQETVTSTNYGCAEVKSLNEPKKKWRYVMRKFKLKQPLTGYTASYEKTGLPTHNTFERREQKVPTEQHRRFSEGSISYGSPAKNRMFKMDYDKTKVLVGDKGADELRKPQGIKPDSR